MIERAATYRAYSRKRLTELAELAGLHSLAWRMPADTGFFQPLLVGRKWSRAPLTQRDPSRRTS